MTNSSSCKPSTPLALATALATAVAAPAPAAPISLHPDNPHYFLWRGQPTVIITSAEHYGAPVNLDFDFKKYLRALRDAGMNNTRVFSGAYVEPEGAFNISRNTLAPLPGRFIAPWARSGEPGYANGGNKFDLTRWDEAYFGRLRELVGYADEVGVTVEFCFFCPMYEEKQWSLSPMNASNNVNGVGDVGREDVYTLDRSGGLLEVQEALTRKLVTELNPFDNVLLEIANEPYFGGVTMEWQHRVADVMAETERGLPNKHLITQNIANNTAEITDPHPAVSVFNFHYATPPDAVATNYHLGKVIGDNETGFRGTANAPYRAEAWDFIIAGGGLFNHLDYSFAAGFEDGTFDYPPTQPGGGNPQLRREFGILRDFINGFDFIRMRPDNSAIRGGVPTGGTARALVLPGEAVAVYVRSEGSTGPWSARWTGFVEAPASGKFHFHTYSNDGVRLRVGGDLLIEDWTDHGEKEDTGAIDLVKGERYPVELEYFYNGGQGATKLWWTPPGGDKSPVPANAFRLPEGDAWGLRGEYFHGADLKRPWATRDDGTVNFAWGVKPPFTSSGQDGAVTLELALDEGTWDAEWIDTKSGEVAASDTLTVTGGTPATLAAPPFEQDIALRVMKR